MRQALELALEALETPRPFDSYPPLWRAYEKTINEAITAIKEALAQPEQRNVTKQEHDVLMNSIKASSTVVSKGFLAQPEQDWIERERAVGYREGHQNALKQMAQPEQEPVAVVDVHEFYDNCANFSLLQKLPKGKHTLYTTPPQRTWVGLTDEEIKQGESKGELGHGFIQGALWAEATLKKKNT